MAGSTISSTVTTTVLLGGTVYPSPLTITAAGAVSPAYYGSTGVLAVAAGVSLVNEGRISGGYGYAGSVSPVQGGVGVDLSSGGDSLANSGTISGTANAGAVWTLAGTNMLGAGAGLRDLGTLTVAGTLTGGAVLIGNAGTLLVTGSLATSTVHFAAGGGALLDLGASASIAGTLTGFAGGDTIEVDRAATTLSYLGGTLTLLDGSTDVASFTLAGHYTTASFEVDSEPDGESRITFVPAASSLPDFAPSSLQASTLAHPAMELGFAAFHAEPTAWRTVLMDIAHQHV
jgi:hypothetical protein